MKKMKNPCWAGYEAIGTKMKNGKEVPNCVPMKEQVEKKISLVSFKDFLSWVKHAYKNNPEPKIDDAHRTNPLNTGK
jgi:hypothetical protein